MNPVILVYPKTNPFPYTISSALSILSVGSYLDSCGIPVEYFDERIHNSRRLFSLLIRCRPSLVGISAMTGYQIRRGVNISRAIKEFDTAIPIVWGGVHASMLPAETIQPQYVDFVIKGEGEITMRQLCEALATEKKDLRDIEGLAWKEDGRIIENRNRAYVDINALPFPYSGKGLDLLSAYKKKGGKRPPIGYEISRGCSYACTYCYNQFFHHSVVRRKKREKYVSELHLLKRLEFGKVVFYDINLASSKQDLIELCASLREVDIEWRGSMRMDCIDEEVRGQLERSRCEYVFFGLESMDEHCLRKLNKRLSVMDIQNCVKIMSEWKSPRTGINKTYSLLCGLPGETKGDLYRILDLMDSLKKMDRRAGIALNPYLPLPGTALYDEACAAGFQKPRRLNEWEAFSTGNVIGPWITHKKLLRDLYLIAFLAFRTKQLLSFGYYPFYLCARLRWKFRFFRGCLEAMIFDAMKSCVTIFDMFPLFLSRYLIRTKPSGH